MFGGLWDCLLLIKVDLGQHPLTHLPPTSQQTILPWPDIMVGSRRALQWGSAIFQVRDPIFWLKVSNTCSIPGKLWNRSKVEVANWASGGQSHLTDFKKSQNIGFFELRSEVSGMVLVDRKVVCIGPDWCLDGSGTVYCWSKLIWDNFLWHICHRPANRPFCLDPI